MNRTFYILFYTGCLCALLQSCGVAVEQYTAAVNERDSLRMLVNNLSSARNGLQADLKARQLTIDELRSDTEELREKVKNLQSQLDKAKAASSEEIKDLLAQLELTQNDLAQREKRLKDVESKLKFRDSTMNALRMKLEKALLGFRESGLAVEVKQGKVYVSLSNQLLFKSGSTSIDKRGKEALKGLAEVLNSQPDISILIEGHTDNVPIASGKFADNWDLSVLRSTEVTRFLSVDNGVDPRRIIASGRSEFFPLDPADTPDARGKNRRTEIILTPRLDELFDVLRK